LSAIGPDAAFDELTPAACYFIGLLATDGCVGGAAGARVSIRLTVGDAPIIHALKAFLGTNAKVSISPRRDGSRPQAGIQIRSLALVKRLTELGVGPRKSLTLRIRDGALLASRDFWRGAIDGDGTVRILTQKNGAGRWYSYPRIQLVSASEDFILQFSDFLQLHDVRATLGADPSRTPGKDHWIYKCVVNNQADVVRLARILYEDCGEHALPRKRREAETILREFAAAPKRKAIITAALQAEIVRLYRAKVSSNRIAESLGLTTTAVTNTLKRAGVPIRSRSGNHATKQYSEAEIVRTYERLRSTRRTAVALGVSRDTVRKVLKLVDESTLLAR